LYILILKREHVMRYHSTFLRIFIVYALSAIAEIQAVPCNKNRCCPTPSSATICTPVTVDYIIVGLGTAGATLARYLSDAVNGTYTNSVLVFEAGSNYSDTEDIMTTDELITAAIAYETKYSRTYSVGIAEAMVGPSGYIYTEGRLWGGGSAHNDRMAVRSSFDIYDLWATRSGNPRWLYANLLPKMKGMEKYTVATNSLPPDLAQRGVNGALFISQENYTPTISANPFSMQFATTAGAPLVQDFNIQSVRVGTSANQQFATPPAGDPSVSVRSFSVSAFLPETIIDWTTGIGLNGRKLQVVSQATVARVLFDTTGSTPTAIGVEYILDGNREQVLRAYARKKVILCAGSIQDTGILQRSGVGPSMILTPLNIPVIVDNPNVGVNLQNHCGTSAIMQIPTPGPFALAESFIDCSEATGIGANFTPGVRRNQILFGAGTAFFTDASVLQALNIDPDANYASFITFNVRPQSHGEAFIVDTDPLTDVQVNFGFYTDGDVTDAGSDAQNIVAALRIIEQTAVAFGGTMIFPTPTQYAAGNQALFEAAANLPVLAYHSVGTCRMAASMDDGVVDGNLQVFGVNNLMCADCSVIPQITTGNTAYPAFVIGLEAAVILGATVPTA
jgi:choline dehydrogenase